MSRFKHKHGASEARTPAPENTAAQGAAPDTSPQDGASLESQQGTAEAWTEEEAPPVLELECARLSTELAAEQDRLLRLRAEFDNYRRRAAQDLARAREQAVDRVVLTLLPALDDLDRVTRQGASSEDLDALRRGLDMVAAKVTAQLEQVGVKAFASVGQPFDPARHEALSLSQLPDKGDDEVVDEHVRGYQRGDTVLRHAQVIVNKR